MPDSFRGVALLAVALACSACSRDDKNPSSVPDAGGEGGAGAQPDAATGGAGGAVSGSGGENDGGPSPIVDAGPPDAPIVPIDGAVSPTANGSFETARPIPLGGRRELQDIVEPFQTAYFSFEAKAGSFYEISTYATAYSPDNVMTLYDADHEKIGENDVGQRWPGDRVDARLVVRLEHDGTYFVKLADPALGPDAFLNPSFTDYFYYLGARELVSGAPGTGFEGGAMDFDLDESSGYSFVTLVGEFHDGKDSIFPFAGRAGQALIGQVLASGVPGNGSTAEGGQLQVSTKQGTILAGIDRAEGQTAIHPPIEGGSYTFTAIPSGELGDNPFYAVDLVMIPENPVERSSGDNGSIAAAEPIDMKGGFVRRGLLLATVDGEDVDYFSFDATASETVIIACEAESAGSGVRSLRAEVRDADDAVLASAVETPIANLYITPFVVEATGTHYLRLGGQAASAPMIDPWVRCVVNVGP